MKTQSTIYNKKLELSKWLITLDAINIIQKLLKCKKTQNTTMLTLREQKIANLQAAIELGEKSGMISDFNYESFLESLHKKYL